MYLSYLLLTPLSTTKNHTVELSYLHSCLYGPRLTNEAWILVLANRLYIVQMLRPITSPKVHDVAKIRMTLCQLYNTTIGRNNPIKNFVYAKTQNLSKLLRIENMLSSCFLRDLLASGCDD